MALISRYIIYVKMAYLYLFLFSRKFPTYTFIWTCRLFGTLEYLCMDFLIDGRRIGCLEGPRITTGGAGAWDPNYTPGVDFLDHNFLSSKNSG